MVNEKNTEIIVTFFGHENYSGASKAAVHQH